MRKLSDLRGNLLHKNNLLHLFILLQPTTSLQSFVESMMFCVIFPVNLFKSEMTVPNNPFKKDRKTKDPKEAGETPTRQQLTEVCLKYCC